MIFSMKMVTVTIPEELNAEAAAEARRLGISKSELIRRGLAAVLPDERSAMPEDLWTGLAGFGSRGLSAGPGEIDEAVYSR